MSDDVPKDDRKGQKVILKSLGRCLVESSLAGDSPVRVPNMGILIDATVTYWLENQDTLLLECLN